jgi:hypothetical protein
MKLTNQTVRIAGITLIIVLVLSSICPGQHRAPKKIKVKDHIMYSMLDPGEIPAILKPEFIPAIKADKFFFANEPLIAVVDGKTAKAYSKWHLDGHQVVNDIINGRAITVTW